MTHLYKQLRQEAHESAECATCQHGRKYHIDNGACSHGDCKCDKFENYTQTELDEMNGKTRSEQE